MGSPKSNRSSPRTKSFSSSSSPSAASSTYMTSPPPPRLPPMSPSSFTVPFSWEKHPGVPKQGAPANLCSPPPTINLPLPPPIKPKRSPPSTTNTRKKRTGQDELDPFSAALQECSKQEERWRTASVPVPASSRRKGAREHMSAFRRPFDLYGSCRSSNSSVVDSTVYVPRSGQSMVAYGLLHGRHG